MYAGGGTEIPSHYPQWRVEYAKFDSPILLQGSLTKLLDGKLVIIPFSPTHIYAHMYTLHSQRVVTLV